jgi:hypothetical protein
MNDIDVRQIRIVIHTASVINVKKFVKLKFVIFIQLDNCMNVKNHMRIKRNTLPADGYIKIDCTALRK